MAEMNSSFDMFVNLNSYIHPEVQKLYPDAELPHFNIDEHSDERLVMTYSSSRSMASLAHGLMIACIEHFNETADISKKVIKEDGSEVQFTIQRT